VVLLADGHGAMLYPDFVLAAAELIVAAAVNETEDYGKIRLSALLLVRKWLAFPGHSLDSVSDAGNVAILALVNPPSRTKH
jgi:hypothetical protein